MLPDPRGASGGKTILTTFAGRRDRMALLCRYVRAALAQGILDEWHVWDFTRDPEDAAWLRREFPHPRMTPSQGQEYFTTAVGPHAGHLHAGSPPTTLRLAVAARHDVHIGLQRESGAGDSYEIVLGGWANTYCVIRAFADPDMLRFPDQRPQGDPHVTAAETPGLLPEWGYADIAVHLGAEGINVEVDGRTVLSLPGPVAPGDFSVLRRSGYGADAEWRLADPAGQREFLFLPTPPAIDNPSAPYPFYLPTYRHYARLHREHRDDILLKCDDDVVFIDLDGLRRFIAYRRLHPEYFLLSANVVNNGACAYFQQQAGLIPRELMDLELPRRPLGRKLWGSAAMAETLHDYFLSDPRRFTGTAMGVRQWNERMSINFIALLGADLVHIPDIMWDDEHFLCHDARVRARKANAIFGPFCVSHLTFVAQEQGFDHARVLDGYARLAERLGPVPDAAAADAAAADALREGGARGDSAPPARLPVSGLARR